MKRADRKRPGAVRVIVFIVLVTLAALLVFGAIGELISAFTSGGTNPG